MENQERILFLIYVYLKPLTFIPILNASSLIMHLTLSLAPCNQYNIRIFGRGTKSTVWMSCEWQWQLRGCRCWAHLVSCHRGRKPTCLWARTGSPPASLPARGALLACSHTGTGGSQWHTEMVRETDLVQANTACVWCINPSQTHSPCAPTHLGHSYSNSRANPHSWRLNLHKLFSN